MKQPDRLPEIKAFAKEHGYNALTGSDAFWLIEEVERLQFERDCLAGYAEGLLGLSMSVEEYIASRKPDGR